MQELVQAQINKAKRNGRTLSYAAAYEEMVADSMETMLADGKIVEKLAKLKAQDKSLWQKIKDFISELAAKIRKIYEGLAPDSAEGRYVAEMKDAVERLQELFAEGLTDAAENYQAAGNSTQNIENGGEIAYSKRSYQKVFFKENVFPPFNESQSEAHELAERWAKSEKTESGERKLISFHNKWYLIESFDDLKYGYQIMKKLTKQEYAKEASYYGTITGYQSIQDSLSEDVAQHLGRSSNGDAGHRFDNDAPKHRGKNQTVHGLGENEIRRKTSERNDTGNLPGSSLDSQGENGSSVKKNHKKYSMRDTAVEYFGRTYSWKETGYLLTDGTKLDFSGRHEGATGGYRTVDHRDILDIYPDDAELDGNGAMVDFMSQGNIRIMPEGDGINLTVQPTKAQERALDDFISRVRGEVTLDIDDANGNTVVSVEYPRGTRASKVLQDIRNYFENGTEPVVSDIARFYYQDRSAESISNRSLLATALDSVAQTEGEKFWLAKYKERIAQLDEQEAILRKLNAEIRELSFSKGKRDTAKLRQLRDEATKTANRINLHDKKLLRYSQQLLLYL